MPDESRDCYRCQHYRSVQTGPNAWTHDCGLGQVDFPVAAQCNSYQPAPFWQKPEGNGLPENWLESWP